MLPFFKKQPDPELLKELDEVIITLDNTAFINQLTEKVANPEKPTWVLPTNPDQRRLTNVLVNNKEWKIE